MMTRISTNSSHEWAVRVWRLLCASSAVMLSSFKRRFCHVLVVDPMSASARDIGTKGPGLGGWIPAVPACVGPIRRRRAFVMNADVVGYCRLMASDEFATLTTLLETQCRIAALVDHHGGRVVDAPGDNVLAEFADAVSAFACAKQIHRGLAEQRRCDPKRVPMTFRIGLHGGDVLVGGERIYGEVVNIAARLQSAADSGGILLSECVIRELEASLRADVETVRSGRVRDVPHHVRLYRHREWLI